MMTQEGQWFTDRTSVKGGRYQRGPFFGAPALSLDAPKYLGTTFWGVDGFMLPCGLGTV